jgi:hypothetical protein
MKREVFNPLSMKNTYVATFLGDSGRAIRYSSADLTRFEFDFSHSYSAGASFIYSSVHDLALFSMLHLNRAGGNAIISEKAVSAMQDTVARNDSDYYGLGWWINKDFYGYKGALAQGGTFFSNAWLQLIPSEGIAVAILANGGGGDMSALLNEVLSELLPEFKRNLVYKAPTLQNQHNDQFLPRPSSWQGLISTYKGDIPITFHFNGTEGSSATLNTKRIELKNVQTKPAWYSFSIEGDLGLEDTGRGPYNLTFYLNQHSKVLYGSVETSSSIHPDTPQLAYWVKLKQVK